MQGQRIGELVWSVLPYMLYTSDLASSNYPINLKRFDEENQNWLWLNVINVRVHAAKGLPISLFHKLYLLVSIHTERSSFMA